MYVFRILRASGVENFGAFSERLASLVWKTRTLSPLPQDQCKKLEASASPHGRATTGAFCFRPFPSPGEVFFRTLCRRRVAHVCTTRTLRCIACIGFEIFVRLLEAIRTILAKGSIFACFSNPLGRIRSGAGQPRARYNQLDVVWVT